MGTGIRMRRGARAYKIIRLAIGRANQTGRARGPLFARMNRIRAELLNLILEAEMELGHE